MYNDAKRGTLSAWSFPSRYVASLIGDQLDLQEPHTTYTPSATDLQYVNPSTHREMLLTIADTDRKSFVSCLQNILAVSLRVDGAIDKQHLDNKHVMAKYVTDNGVAKTVYLGFNESLETGSFGLFKAVQEAIKKVDYPGTNYFQKLHQLLPTVRQKTQAPIALSGYIYLSIVEIVVLLQIFLS